MRHHTGVGGLNNRREMGETDESPFIPAVSIFLLLPLTLSMRTFSVWPAQRDKARPIYNQEKFHKMLDRHESANTTAYSARAKRKSDRIVYTSTPEGPERDLDWRLLVENEAH
jgi:hypothetical protein